MPARIAVVGDGIAGALLAWRLAGAGATVTVFGGAAGPDATAVSGGLTRGFEPDLQTCRLAAESLAELLADPDLARSAGYRRTGSVYVLPSAEDLDRPLKELDGLLPGGAAVLPAAELADRYGFRGLPGSAVGVVEPQAGYLSPDALRHFALATVDRAPAPADPLAPGPYDLVVLAAGRWTGRLLAAAGLPDGGLRTKALQYGLHPAGGWAPPAFVDETTGLWGRPADGGTVLLGLPSSQWDVDPDRPEPDALAPARVARAVLDRFGVRVGEPVRVVAAADGYADPPVLELRPVRPGLFTFAGGSGGAAKYALAASRAAATALLR
jgi:glycine/D-amino acid oxidase-like deaminating enzyme